MKWTASIKKQWLINFFIIKYDLLLLINHCLLFLDEYYLLIFKWVSFHLFVNEVIEVKVNTRPLLFLDKNPMVWNVVYNYIWENRNNILQPIKTLKPVLSGPVKRKKM